MNIAVTGANGFLGSKIVSGLSALERHTTALIRPNADRSLLPPGQKVLELCYDDPSQMREALDDCDVLVHNAGKTRTLSFDEMLEANLGLTSRVLEAVNASSLKHFIYISSQAASRPSLNGEAIDETMPSAPVSWYGKSKLWAERLIQSRCTKPWTIIRPVPVYGEGDRDFLGLFKMAVTGLSFRLGSDSQILNMIHADQLCVFIKACIDTPAARGEIFFASDGQSYTQAQILSIIASGVGKQPLLSVKIPLAAAIPVFQAGELISRIRGKVSLLGTQKYLELSAPHWNCDVSKARSLLGWNPEPQIEQRVKDAYQWYRAHGWL